MHGYTINIPYEKYYTYNIISKSEEPDTSPYMWELSGKYVEGYYKAMYDNIIFLIRRYTQTVVPRKSVDDHKIFTCN